MNELYLTYTMNTGLILLVVSIAVGFIRLAIGPTLVDRIVALDMMTAAVIAFCAIYAIKSDSEAYLDIAIALALVSFISVIAFARYAATLALKRSKP